MPKHNIILDVVVESGHYLAEVGVVVTVESNVCVLAPSPKTSVVPSGLWLPYLSIMLIAFQKITD